MTLHVQTNATLHDGSDTGIQVCRGKSGRLYPDISTAMHDCADDALVPTGEQGVYKHRPTGHLVTLDSPDDV